MNRLLAALGVLLLPSAASAAGLELVGYFGPIISPYDQSIELDPGGLILPGGAVVPPGQALLLSLLLRPPAGSQVQQLSLVAGLAVAETLEPARDLASLKWPNDVLLGGRKVAGILLEASGETVVCGIGVNVSQTEAELPADTRLPAASLFTAMGQAPERAELLASLLLTLEHRYDAWRHRGLAPLVDELEARNALRGHAVRIGHEAGTVVRIALDGRLALRRDDGTEVLVGSGEVVELEAGG